MNQQEYQKQLAQLKFRCKIALIRLSQAPTDKARVAAEKERKQAFTLLRALQDRGWS